jgi:glucose/arabinose dehydrogenase
LKKQIIIASITAGMFFLLLSFVLTNSEIRYEILQDVGIKSVPKIVDDSYSIEPLAIGIPNPYHITILGNDVFFNERFTGNLYLIKNGEFQSKPTINVSLDNEQTKIHGVGSFGSSIFIHVTDANYEEGLYENNRILEYTWNGKKLNLIQEIKPQILFTDMHHSGGIIVDDNKNVFSTYPEPIESPLLDYYGHGVHGFTFDSQTNNIWHTTEVDKNLNLKEILSDTDYYPDEYEKLHVISIEDMENHKYWEVPYYPSSLVIPDTNFSKKFQNSIFVGFCKGGESKGGIYEYPLDSQRTDFLIPNAEFDFLGINHEKYLMAENFYCVSDMEVGSDGAIYVSDHTRNGAIYKIVPKS